MSKKYERTGYNGKHVFRKDSSIPNEELQKSRDRLEKLERAFRESRSLVVSMQEAKGDNGGSKNQQQEINPSSSVRGALSIGYSNMAALQSMDQRLAVIRSQIDRSSAALSRRGGFMSSTGLSGPGTTSRSDMMQAMLLANQARGGLSRYASAGLSSGGFLAPAGPAPQTLLQELYERRQQLLLNSVVLANSVPAALPASGATDRSPSTTKHSYEALSSKVSSPIADSDSSVEEPDAKRARAA